MQETLNTFTKIVRNLEPQKREDLAGEITRVTNALKEAAELMQCIADAAQKAGISKWNNASLRATDGIGK